MYIVIVTHLTLVQTRGGDVHPVVQAPAPAATRLAVEIAGVGLPMICETPSDIERTRTAWRLLVDDPASPLIVLGIDDAGHLIDARHVRQGSIATMLGPEVRELLAARLAAHARSHNHDFARHY